MKNLHFYGGTGKLNNVNIDAKQQAYLETYSLLQWEPFIILTKKANKSLVEDKFN